MDFWVSKAYTLLRSDAFSLHDQAADARSI